MNQDQSSPQTPHQPAPQQQLVQEPLYPAPMDKGGDTTAQDSYQQQPSMNIEYSHVPKSETGEFSQDLCGCTSNCLTCCLAYCCACCVYGQNQVAIKPESSCVGQSAIYCIVSMLGCAPCLGAYGRQNIRDARHAPGDFIADCVAHWCCPCLALTQENSELKEAGLL